MLSALLWSAPAPGVSVDWVSVGDPGNACDELDGGRCWGAVGYRYRMGTFEVTNDQYVEFLNAVAASDDFLVYNESMSTHAVGGIDRFGAAGSYTYASKAGRGDLPVNFVSYNDGTRFANWLHNGQPVGAQDASTTEDGAYTFELVSSSWVPGARNPDASIFLPNNDEWHKAAYYDAVSMSYSDYPGGTISNVFCSAPTSTPHRYNCSRAVNDVTPVGAYSGTPTPYGTFDQGGNVLELIETPLAFRFMRGGTYRTSFTDFESGVTFVSPGEREYAGFRLAAIPEPGTGLLLLFGLASLAARRPRAA